MLKMVGMEIAVKAFKQKLPLRKLLHVSGASASAKGKTRALVTMMRHKILMRTKC